MNETNPPNQTFLLLVLCVQVCGVTGRGYTYAESRAAARRFAASLRRAGFKNGDVLAVALYNCPEFHLVLLGAIEAGLVVTTVNPQYTSGSVALIACTLCSLLYVLKLCGIEISSHGLKM
jgi:acyl-CoA synthetase (AMP-forming)/AMP-acid ligase II